MKSSRSVVVVVATVAVALVVLSSCSPDKDVLTGPTSVPGAGLTTTDAPTGAEPPCDGASGVGGAVPAGAAPGDLIAATNLDATYGDTLGYPTGASTWRVLYVSSGVDENDLQLVCGIAAAPKAGPRSEGGSGHLLAWSHGTIGLQQACLPSTKPATAFWGKMSGGIGAVSWGSGPGARTGDPADGALQTALDRGWVVSATDYQPNDTYIMGRVAAANVIDAARATTQLMAREFGTTATPENYDTIAWGHSQGGHAALWAGQLFESYQAGTPNPRSATLTLRGVAAEAPASNLIAQPDRQRGVELGDGLADWEMHTTVKLIGLPIPALELQIGPALFSYIFGSWAEFSRRGVPSPDAEFPAYPQDAAGLNLGAVATAQGQETIAQVQTLCLDKADTPAVKKLVAPYRNAAANAMLTKEMWNLPKTYKPGQFFHGGADSTCATTDDPDLVAWCSWIRWNTPGPLGDNPFPKVPMVDGRPVPLLIVQGADDDVIHCIPAKSSDTSEVPAPADCMNVALFDTLRDEAYCPASGDTGHLHLALLRKNGASSPATHLSIPGQIAAAGSAKNSTDLTFVGSPLDTFMTGSFAGTLAPGCSATVVNPA